MDITSLAEGIKARRLLLHMSQGDVARKINVTRQAVSSWEKGDVKTLRANNIAALEKVLQFQCGELLSYYTQETPPPTAGE